MPDSYQFLAPRGCGTALNQLLSRPEKLKATFLSQLEAGKPLVKGLGPGEMTAVISLACTSDFSVFKSVELIDALAQHAKTPYHAERFGSPLANRPAPRLPPDHLALEEARYVQQLLDVYRERYPREAIEADNVRSNRSVGEHFQRQREAFFKAESLRVYARDSVPPGTFDQLQEDVFAGVVDIADAPQPSGWARMSLVLAHVGSLDLNRHTLIQVADIEDRKGMCHQLANTDRLTWVHPT